MTHGLSLRTGPARSLDVDIDLGDRRVTGTVGNVWGNNLVPVSYSSLGAKHRIAAWIDALALAAGHPDENWTAHTVGKHRTGGQVAMIRPLPEHEARAWLRQLIDVHDRGQCEPLPLPVKTSLAYAEDYRFAVDRPRRRPRRQGRARVDDAALQRDRLPARGPGPVARARLRRARAVLPAQVAAAR